MYFQITNTKHTNRRDLVLDKKKLRSCALSLEISGENEKNGEVVASEKMALTTSQLLKVRGRVWTLEMDESHV